MSDRLIALADRFDVAALMLVFMCVLILAVLWRASRAQDFRLAAMLKDEAGKESALRFGCFISIAVSTWCLMRVTLAAQITADVLVQIFYAYLFTWSGSLVFVKVIEKWNGVLPWSKP